MAIPERLTIPHDEHRFPTVGRYGTGNQFIAYVSGAYPTFFHIGVLTRDEIQNNWAKYKRWYAVLHRFDYDGRHLETVAWNGGTSADGEQDAVNRAYDKLDQLLAGLGEHTFCNVSVRPFRVVIDDVLFGLIPGSSKDLEDYDGGEFFEWIMLEPRDIMFHPPWDGDYST